jgi:hydrogenase/urease accessory protein HupE
MTPDNQPLKGCACRHAVAAIVAAALVFVGPVAIHAHDPGLSSLELRIGERDITATLSMAASDARAAAIPASSGGPSPSVLAADMLDLRIDGRRLPAIVRSSADAEDSGTSAVVAFARVPGTTLTIRSAVPARVGLGHRQLLRITAADDRPVTERMLGVHENAFDLDLRSVPPETSVAVTFLRLGVTHILEGYDHLFFLAALLLAQRRLRDVVKTVTAFTVAHSLTLGAAVCGFLAAPGWLVEPAIAASIVFVGLENLLRDRDRIGSRWKLTFAFGLVHGFGFAGALQELGVGGGGAEVASRLAFFNSGVEIGQVAAALVLWPIVQRLNAAQTMHHRLAPVCSALVVLMGVYWFVKRTIL